MPDSRVIPLHVVDLPEADAPPRNPHGHVPPRRPGSVRRTSSIDVIWPQDAPGTVMRVDGRARDLVTSDASEPIIVTQDALSADIEPDRTISRISSQPPREGIERLVGARGGGHLREALNRVLPQEKTAGSPLYLLIDDLAGSSLVAMWGWTQWMDLSEVIDDVRMSAEGKDWSRPVMEGVCIGYRPGASSLHEDGRPRISLNATPVVDLPLPGDPYSWHDLPDNQGVAFRRARHIDVWHDGVWHVEAGFQDSANHPDGGRVAIHEYRLTATIDPDTFELLTVEASPGTLPYSSCPAAVLNIDRLVGTPVGALRTAVLEQLAKTAGCTHLNDALRSLAEVPVLAGLLQRAPAAGNTR